MIGKLMLAVAGAAVLAAPAAAAGSTRTIAVVTQGHLRAVVTAHKTSGGSAPTATLTVTGYRAGVGRTWHRARSSRVAGTFFWKTVTAQGGVCHARLTGTMLKLSILVSPSIGCSVTNGVSLA